MAGGGAKIASARREQSSVAKTAYRTYDNYIGGDWKPAASGETFDNRNPANRDEVVAAFAASGGDEVFRQLVLARSTSLCYRA